VLPLDPKAQLDSLTIGAKRDRCKGAIRFDTRDVYRTSDESTT
jgi:hypothetical protein